MNILEHLDKDNLHHAYLIEGPRDLIVPKILAFCENINIKTSGNPDFCHIVVDNFKIDEAFDLRAMSTNKSFTSIKKIFLICVNSFSQDAENVLLKMFEEPIENTHFFVIVPDTNALLKTFVSRFYLIKIEAGVNNEYKDAEIFIEMSKRDRIDFIKELLTPTLEEVGAPTENVGADLSADSTRSKALKFLNELEFLIHEKLVKDFSILLHPSDGSFHVQNSLQVSLNHFFKVREFLRMPGSSTKSLMESIALILPNLQK